MSGDDPARALAERVRLACRARFATAWEEAGVAGLCHEGRLEFALDAVATLDLTPLLADPERPQG